nr:DNA adenine methylase [Allorhodopirellula solitaria]
MTQPLKWHGGKYYLRKWIVGLMPPHLHYVEPFFGGGGIFLARDPSRDWMATGDEKLPSALKGSSEVVNDLHGELINFWRVLQDPADFDAFRQRMEMTPFSEAEFERALELSKTDSSDATALDRAIQFFILARQSRQGLMKDFATLSRNRTRSRINEQASAWLNVVSGLADVHDRLQGVVILNQKATDVIRKQDGANTLFYCDPPYVHESRATTGEYAFEMSEVEHEQLLETLAAVQGKFMLSGYPSDLYTKWEQKHNWTRHEMMIDNKAAAGAAKEKKTECLWCNF